MIAVIGGGISGLAAGHRLAAVGLDAVVLEATGRAGGVIDTRSVGGRTLEVGPQRTRLTPPLQRLVDELGLASSLRLAADLPLYIYVDGRLRQVPMDLPSLLTTDLIGWADRLRALSEPFTEELRQDESVHAFFARKFGHDTARRALDPLFGGLYASDPTEMRARHALADTLERIGRPSSLLRTILRGIRSGPRTPACSFEGGLRTLTDALAAALGDRFRPSTPVHAVARDGTGLRVILDREELVVDRVVLACPSAAAARILEPLDRDAARRIGRLRLNRLATVHLESTVELGASGYQVSLDEPFATHGVTSQHDLFDRTGLYTAFLGGSGRARSADLPDDEVAALAATEFEAITGEAARPLAVHRTAIPAWDLSWDALEGLTLPAGVAVCASWRGRPGITGRLLEAEGLARRMPGSGSASPAHTGTGPVPALPG